MNLLGKTQYNNAFWRHPLVERRPQHAHAEYPQLENFLESLFHKPSAATFYQCGAPSHDQRVPKTSYQGNQSSLGQHGKLP